jgi:hypothetical protein
MTSFWSWNYSGSIRNTVYVYTCFFAQGAYWSMYCLSKEEEVKLESEYTREQDSSTNRPHIFTLNRE